MANLLVSNGYALSLIESTTAGAEVSQAFSLALINFPAEQVDVSGLRTDAVVDDTSDAQTSALYSMVLVLGRTERRKVRAWTFSLDGHDFYVLRLGAESTVVYDVSTGEWSEWNSPNLNVWRAHTGLNWLGMDSVSFNNGATTQIIAGDDNYGRLWYVTPNQGFDESPDDEGIDRAFVRRVTGGIPMRTRKAETCSAVYLTASLGEPVLAAMDIVLRTSDDNGKSWADHGAVTLDPGTFDQEVSWRSLGLVRAPGRIFEITDSGASVRIDGLDMHTTDDTG